MTKNTFKRRTRTTADPGFFTDPLESRRLLSGSLLVDLASAIQVGGTQVTNGQAIPDGAAASAYAGVGHSDDGANGQGAYLNITGDVIWQWYGGAEVVDLPLTPDGQGRDYGSSNNGLACVLNESAAGVAIPSGAYKGDYILEYYYTGDANWAPTAQVTAAGYQSFLAGNGLGDGQTVFVKFSGGSTQSKLAFIQNPSNTAAGDTIKPPVTVAVEDSGGNFNTSSSDTVTLAIASGSGILSGTLSEPAVNGIVTFSTLSINKLGSHTLTASDTTTSSTTAAISSLFNITGGKLVFLKAPHSANAGEAIQPSLEVALEDSKNKIDTTDNSTVVTLLPIGLSAGNPITGDTATMVGGIATFSNVVLTKPGTYQLQAADGGDTVAATGKFKVTGDKLIFKVQPTKAAAYTEIPVTVEIVNGQGKPNTSATTYTDLSLNTVKGPAGALLLGTTMLPFVNGLAVFTSSMGPLINKAGTYTLTATEVDFSTGVPVPAVTTSPITSKSFNFGVHLEFLKQPVANAKVSVNRTIPFSVALKDGSNATQSKDSMDHITLDLYTFINGVQGASSLAHFDTVMTHGVADFTKISFATPGTYFLVAQAIDASTGSTLNSTVPVGSHVFQVTPLHIVLLQQPGSPRGVNVFNLKVNQPLPFIVALKDANGVTDSMDSVDQIQLDVFTIVNGVSATTPTTTYAMTVQRGLADFGKITFATAGTYGITVSELDATGSPVTTTMYVFSDTFQIN